MNIKVQDIEKLIESSIDSVTTNPHFLKAFANIVNANSYRKIWMRKTFEAIWKDLELPVRQEQEKISYQIEELQVRIKKLELNLGQVSSYRSVKEPTSATKTQGKNRLRDKGLEL